jgi:predicted nucleic acid-binding protein
MQNVSMVARRFRRQFRSPVIWWGTTVEIHSGLARLQRLNEIDQTGTIIAVRKWEIFEREANVIRPVEYVVEIAITLPELYELRSQDAFQLAAALVWCSEKPRNRPFVSADTRLCEAAAAAGFDVVPLV